jgi:hypothetical protein
MLILFLLLKQNVKSVDIMKLTFGLHKQEEAMNLKQNSLDVKNAKILGGNTDDSKSKKK